MAVEIRQGDVMDRLAEMPGESVHCVVTSPPYWGLRCYGIDGQLGQEPTMAEHIAVMVGVFREVRRVMRKDATLWLNYGDCYAGSWGSQGHRETPAGLQGNSIRNHPKTASNTGSIKDKGLKPKDLCMIPNRLAIALQDDGWWIRSEIVWAKPNPMPESVTDRPTSAHEKLWLCTKAQRYFYDTDAVRTEAQPVQARNVDSTYHAPGNREHTGLRKQGISNADKQRGHSRKHAGFNDRWDAMTQEEQQQGANLRNVWTIATKPFSEAHFATFPPDLAETCIKAGCPKGGTVLDPFGGSGTTGLVADRLGRNAILIELNPEYAEMARRRIQDDAGMFAEVTAPAEVARMEAEGLV